VIAASGVLQIVRGGTGNDRCLSTRFGTGSDRLYGGRGRDRYEADANDSVQGAEQFVTCYPDDDSRRAAPELDSRRLEPGSAGVYRAQGVGVGRRNGSVPRSTS
jgi:Ca2+-binding RTX toxin-like protein